MTKCPELVQNIQGQLVNSRMGYHFGVALRAGRSLDEARLAAELATRAELTATLNKLIIQWAPEFNAPLSNAG